MPDELLIQNCAPTLAGIKTANLFSCACETEEDLRATVRRLNRLLTGKGLRVLPLRLRNGRALIYVYRPALLRRDWDNALACELLSERGYCCEDQGQCLRRLMTRLREDGDFPHEIGLFLGYPPEDVRGFIENRAGGCKCIGCWKVYGDEERAKTTFAQYKTCTECLCAHYAKGMSLEALAVAG